LPLGLTGIVGPAALIVILFAQPLALSTPALWLLAGIAGAFSPPISVLTRTMWRYRFSDAAARRTAFALDSVLVEFTFTAGPALIALLLAVGSPAIAFSAACLFAVLAVPTFVASPAMRYWRHDPHAERRLLGPLAQGRLLVVSATTFLLTSCLGLLEIGSRVFAARVANVPLAGVLIAINSIGSAVGGLLYGGVPIVRDFERHLLVILAALVVPLAAHIVIASAGWLAVAGFAAGLCIAPAFTVTSMLVSAYAPARYATEAFTWSTTFIVSGIGAGNALGGVLVERFGPTGAFATSAAIAVLATGCAFTLRPSPRS
jgi:hypothetical protein